MLDDAQLWKTITTLQSRYELSGWSSGQLLLLSHGTTSKKYEMGRSPFTVDSVCASTLAIPCHSKDEESTLWEADRWFRALKLRLTGGRVLWSHISLALTAAYRGFGHTTCAIHYWELYFTFEVLVLKPRHTKCSAIQIIFNYSRIFTYLLTDLTIFCVKYKLYFTYAKSQGHLFWKLWGTVVQNRWIWLKKARSIR